MASVWAAVATALIYSSGKLLMLAVRSMLVTQFLQLLYRVTGPLEP